jgi:segregation and condensation protein B
MVGGEPAVEQQPGAEQQVSFADPEGLSLTACVESMLFVADAPVATARLAEALEVAVRDVEAALVELDRVYTGRGLCLQRFGNRVQLVTAPAASHYIERFLGLENRVRFSRAALETLAIISYRQPITRPQIEAIRGVNSDSVIRTLLSGGQIEEVGRAMTVGRPILYGTTFEFLQQFGLRNLEELPPLEDITVVEEIEL